jgi:magnesium transporter
LGSLLDSDVIAELNEHVREALIDTLDPGQVADIAAELDTDDAVAIIEDLEEDEQRAVLRALAPDDRAAIEEALSYPEESAGRLMQRELIAVPEHWTVGQVIDYLRENGDLTTDFWEVFVVDPQHRPVGTCQLSWILRTPRPIGIADVMKREQTLIPVDMDQEEVALRFQKYALISAAVSR